MLRKRTIIILLILAGVGYWAYGRFLPHGGWGGPMGAPPKVSVAEVIERDVRPWSEFAGRLVAVDQAEVRPRVSGVIEKVHFADGAMVTKGDVLFTIDPRPFQAALEAARARAALADAELTRAETLIKDKAIPQREYDQRKNDAAVAHADLARAKLDLEYAEVRAPISGRAGRVEITEGNMVETNAGAPLLTTIVSNKPIYADFEVDETSFLTYVQAGITGNKDVHRIPVMMGLSTENGTPHGGAVESFDNQLNIPTGSIRVRAVFDNDDGTLVPGLFARIKLGSADPIHAILVTDRAIGTDQNKKFVLVVGEGNKTEHREVKLGGLADGLRIVTEGLKPGEKIIVSGMQRVMMPGQPVVPEAVAMEGEVSGSAIQNSEKKMSAPLEDNRDKK